MFAQHSRVVLGLIIYCLPIAVQLRSLEAEAAQATVDNDDGVSVCCVDAPALGLQSRQQMMN